MTYANGRRQPLDHSRLAGAPGAFGKSSPTTGRPVRGPSPTLYWAASSGATSYEYCYDTTDDGAAALDQPGSEPNVTLSGLTRARPTTGRCGQEQLWHNLCQWCGDSLLDIHNWWRTGAFGKAAPATGDRWRDQPTLYLGQPAAVRVRTNTATTRRHGGCTTWVNWRRTGM